MDYHRTMSPLFGLIQVLLVGLVIGLVGLMLSTAWMLTHPPRRTYAWAVSRSSPGDPGELDEPLRFTASTVNTPRGGLPVWDIEGRDPNAPVVFMTHGWGSSRIGALKRIPALADHASRIIAWDLPGHGDAPSSARLGADEHALGAQIIDELVGDDAPLVLMGWSMGAGISLALAQQIQRTHDVRGVVCESVYRLPITPARAVLALRGMPHRLSLAPALMLIGIGLGIGRRWPGFDRAKIGAGLGAPVLLLHGSTDPVSPIADAIAVSEASVDAELCVLEGAGHNNIWTDPVYRRQATDVAGAFVTRVSRR